MCNNQLYIIINISVTRAKASSISNSATFSHNLYRLVMKGRKSFSKPDMILQENNNINMYFEFNLKIAIYVCIRVPKT